MLIRPERPEDAGAVRDVHAAAFRDQAPDGSLPAEVTLVDALRSAGDLVPALCLVAEVDGVVAGHVTTSRGTPDGLVAVGPIGVLPAHQGQGIGSGLMHSVVAAAEALWYVGVVLLGDPAFYRRFGFVEAGTVGLEPAHDWPREAFQVRPLPSSWTGGYPAGTVFRYPAAFDALS